MPEPIVDIVLPVYNALSCVKACLRFLDKNTPSSLYRLYIVDDGSDHQTSLFLSEYDRTHPESVLITHKDNMGYVQSCNQGMIAGNASYVLLLNSDVVASPGWLEKLLACAASDTSIAAVNPMTNFASQININMPPGSNFLGLNHLFQKRSPSYPDVVTCVGFCLLLRRSALEKVGLFDPIFGKGYCEESDLCMRLTTNGYRTVLADNVYVYHKGRASFTTRDTQYHRNRKIFDDRWEKAYSIQFKRFLEKNPLAPIRSLVRGPERLAPRELLTPVFRSALQAWQNKNFIQSARIILQGALRLVSYKRQKPQKKLVDMTSRPGRLRVTYLLRDMVVAGGVLSVIQLVNELILMGVEARIAALYEDPAIYDWSYLYTSPMIFRNEQDLIKNLPDTDIIVATLWVTAEWADNIQKSGRAAKSVYFVQDFEPWFFGEQQQEMRSRVLAGYRKIQQRIVKSDWLQALLADHYLNSQKISLGLNLEVFYPRSVTKSIRPVVLAMARPGTPRRGFDILVKSLTTLKLRLPEVDIHLFGARNLSKYGLPFEYQDHGLVFDQNTLARLYSLADVFVDTSYFQGFGRCALEAMACECACVLTNVGGVNEYARDGINCFLVTPGDTEAAVESIRKICIDMSLKEKLVKAGKLTVKKFGHRREARRTLEFFQEII